MALCNTVVPCVVCCLVDCRLQADVQIFHACANIESEYSHMIKSTVH